MLTGKTGLLGSVEETPRGTTRRDDVGLFTLRQNILAVRTIDILYAPFLKQSVRRPLSSVATAAPLNMA